MPPPPMTTIAVRTHFAKPRVSSQDRAWHEGHGLVALVFDPAGRFAAQMDTGPRTHVSLAFPAGSTFTVRLLVHTVDQGAFDEVFHFRVTADDDDEGTCWTGPGIQDGRDAQGKPRRFGFEYGLSIEGAVLAAPPADQ